MHKFVLLSLSLIILNIPANAYAECEAQLKEKLKTDLTLSYTYFDQTMNSGWRTLPTHQCYQEAALLLQAYIEANNSTEKSLIWHLFQMQAFSGNYESALDLTESMLIDKEQSNTTPLLWNDYVLANVAFLANDMKKIKFHRENIASKVEDHFGNSLNLAIVDNLISGFGKPYNLAYEGK